MTNNKLIIRPVQSRDVPILLNFEQQLIAYERPFNPTFISDTFQYYDLAALMADDDSLVLVAEDNGMLVGSGYARLKKAKHYENFEKYAYLGFMFVLPEFRGAGVNKLILQELQNWVLAKGVVEMRLEVYAENGAAVRAYEKAGFKPLMMEMRAAAVMTKHIAIDAPAAAVWEALTQMNPWMSEKELEIISDWTVGGDFIIKGDGFENSGKLLKYEPMRVLSYSHLSSLSELPDNPESYTMLEFTLTGNTELTLQVSNFPTDSIYRHFNFYWNVALNQLKKHIENERTI